jgi:hypothetical protein
LGGVERVLVTAGLVALAVAFAVVIRRRRGAPPTQARWPVPAQLDRGDFEAPDLPWLVVVFTSSTCDSCAQATAKASVLASPLVQYQEVAYQERRDLHQRYGIEVVPLTLLADDEGVVRASFVGVAPAPDLWAAVAEARAGGPGPA